MHRQMTFIAGHQQSRSFVLSRGRRGRRGLQIQALFGGGKKKKEKSYREQGKEDAWAVQQAVLQRRKDGSWKKKADDRRAEVRKYAGNPEYKAKIDAERRAKREKENPDPPINPFSIIIPIVPFGMPEYDDGERFDLRSPYAEKGYVDEESAVGKKFARFFGLGKKKGKDADKSK